MAWLIYTAAMHVVVWCALVPAALVRIWRRRGTRRELDARLGRVDLPPPRAPRLIVHAVSAGEAVSAGAFVRALAEVRPGWSVVMTSGNQDARTVAESLSPQLPTIEAVVPLPWDRRGALAQWLRRLQPAAVVIVEPEIWPNLYRACHSLRVPLFLANARVYPHDVWRYRLARSFFADVLRRPAWIGVQSARERDRFVAIGAPPERLEITGSFKFDALAAPLASAGARTLAIARRSGSPMIVAGSTHEGEEVTLLHSYEQLRVRFPTLRLVLAPRHVGRAARLVAAVRNLGLRVAIASQDTDQEWDVMVLDQLGQLPPLYAFADVAVVGGTLVDCGGHNVLEPARLGCAVVVGPHVDHVRDLVEGLAAAGGIKPLRIGTSEAVADALAGLLADPGKRARLGDCARRYCGRHAGGASRSVEAIVSRLPAERPAMLTAVDPRRARPATWPLGASEAES